MTDGELQGQYQELMKEKEEKEKEKERILNRAAPKGAKFAGVRIEKEQSEQEVDERIAQIAKFKFEMNK
jgi:hypothetical protein